MEEINNFGTSNISSQIPVNSLSLGSSQPEKNIFKVLFFIILGLFIVSLIVFSYFVIKSKKETPSSQTPIIEKINLLKIYDIQLELPLNWTISSVSGNTVKILTDYKEYKVYLILNLNKNDINAESSYQSKSNVTKTQYGEVFSANSGGSKGITGATINSNKYSFEWGIESNQSPPTNLDGIWRPDDNITPEMLLNITKTIRPLIPTNISSNFAPDEVTLNFYKEHVKSDQGFNWYQKSPYLTSELIDSLNQIYLEMTKAGGVGFDAILLAQDTPTTFSAKTIKQDDTSATVNLTESNGWTKTLTIGLILVDGQWKINSITAPTDN